MRHPGLERVPPPPLPPAAAAHPTAPHRRLNQLPPELGAVILLDADTYSLPGIGARFAEQLALLSGEQVMAVGRSGVRGLDAARRLVVPPLYDGLNGGVMLFDLTKFRAFAARYCPGRQW